MRVLLAFVVAPAAGAFLFAAWAAFSDHINAVPYDRLSIFTFTAPLFIGGYPPAVLLGIPAYFILRKNKSLKIITSVSVGAIVASVPWLILDLMLSSETESFPKWIELLQETAMPAVFCGCGAGFVFWLIAR